MTERDVRKVPTRVDERTERTTDTDGVDTEVGTESSGRSLHQVLEGKDRWSRLDSSSD